MESRKQLQLMNTSRRKGYQYSVEQAHYNNVLVIMFVRVRR